MKKTAIKLMIITILLKITGFIKDIILSYFYGTSGIADAYLISLTIPGVIFAFIGIGITTGYIPIYTKIEKEYGELEGNKFTNNLINIVFLICSVILIISLMFTSNIVKVFASGFEGATLNLAIKFTKISIFGIYFIGTTYIFKSYLQIKNNYVLAALVGLPFNFIVMVSIFLSTKINILILALGSLFATVLQLFILITSVYKKGYRYKFIIDFKDKHMKNMIYIALPVIIGSSVNQINALIDRTIASNIAVGGISALNYANKLNASIQSIFVISISTVIYPVISKMAAEKNIKGLKNSITEAISSISLLIIPITVGAMIFAKPIVKLLFGRGAFGSSAIVMTSGALLFYSIGMIGSGFRNILTRAFYSMQDTKTPLFNSMIAVIVNIILNIILSRFMGLSGLALATSIASLLGAVLLFISLRRKIGSFGMKNISISLIKILISSLIMGIIVKGSFEILLKFINSNFSLVLSIVIGALTYGILIYFMKIKEVDVIISLFKNKISKKEEK